MEVTIHIPGLPELADALKAHAGALPRARAAKTEPETALAGAIPPHDAAPAAVVPTDRPPMGNAPAPAAAPVTAAPVAAAPCFTVEQVGTAGAELLREHPEKLQELQALLAQFGAPAVHMLKPEQVGPFATALRGLGAKL